MRMRFSPSVTIPLRVFGEQKAPFCGQRRGLCWAKGLTPFEGYSVQVSLYHHVRLKILIEGNPQIKLKYELLLSHLRSTR